jgi:hypothetical protein
MDHPRLHAALARFDAINAEDPNTVPVAGAARPKELVYAEQMTAWLHRLNPSPSEALQLAARSQHLRRWQIPRDSYPDGRPGYLRWRTALQQFHADEAAKVLREVGYDDATISRVQSLLKKQQLKTDAEMQLLEDVICLVFLENHFADFAREHDDDKVIGIIRKTWTKMSDRGRAAALTLQLPADARRLVERALERAT